MSYHIGQRLSLRDQLCTVRYVGSVAEKPGEWIGVEWDDAARGKHNGFHDGRRYFECRNKSPTAASFLKPKQSWDPPRTFLEALREKYMTEGTAIATDTVYFSTKQAEEVGFAKFAERQKNLQGIRTIVLDRLRIHLDTASAESDEITRLCGHITQLDLSNNLIESLQNVLSLVAFLPKLQHLTLDGNRFDTQAVSNAIAFPEVRLLSLSRTSLTYGEIATVTKVFPCLVTLDAKQNGLQLVTSEPLSPLLTEVSLSDNPFTSLSSLQNLSTCKTLRALDLRRCSVSTVLSADHSPTLSPLCHHIEALDLRDNLISSWTFFNELTSAYPQLRHLQISGNPIYQNLISSDGKSLTSADGYMLTLGRIPHLETLNHSKITEKERVNADAYYLKQIAVALSKMSTERHGEVLREHPRWDELRAEYGEPDIQAPLPTDNLAPNSLATRLVKITFVMGLSGAPNFDGSSWSQEIPKAFSVYALLGQVARKLNIMPLHFRLILETDDQYSGDQERAYQGGEWWDSSDDEDDKNIVSQMQHQKPVQCRQVELVPGTRPIGTYIEGREASIRVVAIEG